MTTSSRLHRRSALGISLALAGALAGSSAACATEPVNLGILVPSASHGWTAGVIWWANEAKKEMEKAHPGIKITIKTAAGAGEQANQLQDLVTVSKINTLVILPFESAPLTPPVAKAKNQGVYVTVVDRGLTDTSAQNAYVAGDNAAFGKISAEYLAKKYNGKANIVVTRGLPCMIDNIRIDAFNAVMKNYPGIKILDQQYGNFNRDDAFKVMQDFLVRFKNIDVVWSTDDDMTLGVLKAMDQAKRKDIKEVLGGSGSKGIIRTIQDGSNPLIQTDTTYSPKMIYEAIKMTVDARSKGAAMPATTLIPSVLVTRNNAKNFYFPSSPF